MKRPKRRSKPIVRRPLPAVEHTPEFEKPFILLVFGVVASSVVFLGIVHGLIRPYQPRTVPSVAFLVVFAFLSAWTARQYGRMVAGRIRRWRAKRGSKT